MTVLALVASLAALLVAVVVALALVEVFEGLNQVRRLRGLEDEPLDVALPAATGSTLTEHGLPAGVLPDRGVLLMISPKCGTCHRLVKSFDGEVPPNLHVVITATDEPSAEALIRDYRLPPGSYTVDFEQAIARSMGVDTTPLAIVVDGGVVVRARTAPSRRSLDDLSRELVQDITSISRNPATRSGGRHG